MSTSTADFETEDLQLARQVDVDQLYRRYSQRTFAFLASMGVRGAEADDIQQRVWLRVLTALRKKQFEGHFRGWLFQIVRNTAIDAQRKKRPDSLDNHVAEETVSHQDAPDQSMIDDEYRSALANCMEKLGEQQRILVKGRLAGDDYASIAQRLQIATSRAHRLFFDAKQALAVCLGRSSIGGQP